MSINSFPIGLERMIGSYLVLGYMGPMDLALPTITMACRKED